MATALGSLSITDLKDHLYQILSIAKNMAITFISVPIIWKEMFLLMRNSILDSLF